MKIINWISYNIFGVPRTYDQFLDCAKSNATSKDVSITPIVVKDTDYLQIDGSVYYAARVQLECGDAFLSISCGGTATIPGAMMSNPGQRLRAKLYAVETAVSIADRLKQDGYNPKVNSLPIETAKTAIEEATASELELKLAPFFA